MTRIKDVLTAAGFACHRIPYKANLPKYVTYQFVTQTATVCAEGVEAETCVQYAIDLYARVPDFAADVPKIREALDAAGWSMVVGPEMYEDDTKYWHLSMTAESVGGVY